MQLSMLALERLRRESAVWITVQSTQGSVPRDTGTWMAVFAREVIGTIGGGRVEFEAIQRALGHLAAGTLVDETQRYALGPSLGQCCGGVMHLRFESVDAAQAPMLRTRLQGNLAPVAVFGGGHVGHALARLLGTLPFALTWIDSRDGIFPADLPPGVTCEHSDPVQDAVRDLAPGSAVLIMSFSHAEDLEILARCLQRQRAEADLGAIGLIGSRTKWATFRHRLEARGFRDDELDRVQCPTGLPGIRGKEPEVIAVAVAARLLQDRIV